MSIAKLLNRATRVLYLVAFVLVVLGIRDRVGAYRHRYASHPLSAPSLPPGSIDPTLFYQMAAESPRMGPADAPVVIVEFLNYTCGYCVSYSAIIEKLQRRYPSLVAVVVKNLLFQPGRAELLLHEGAPCAADQGKLAEYYHEVFAFGATAVSHEPWHDVGDSIHIPDMERYSICVQSGKYRTAMERDAGEAAQLGVVATPTSFVNGLPVVGAVPFDVLNRLVAKLLGRTVKPDSQPSATERYGLDTVRRAPRSARHDS